MQARIATPSDLSLLVTIGRRTFFDTFVGTCTDADMELFLDTSYAPQKVQAELEDPNSHFLILEDETGPIGYSRLLGISTESVELVRFYMEQRAIGTGAAHHLMQDTLDLARQLQYQHIFLGVWENNFRAQKFYEKWGFLKSGEKVFMVGEDPQTDWQYERTL
jgi:ribosomal protein S18 acetylase RimI-like enzyme